MATNLNVTELDFAQIKENLKNFLKQQSQFNDYDFDGAGMNVLLDVLAYNTHYNAINAHYSLNEAFLDSAQIRGNVVTRAKLLGYIPRSTLAPRATVTVTLTPPTGTLPESVTLPRGAKLTTTVGGISFTYVVLNNLSAKEVDGVYTFSNVEIAEGELRTLRYRVDNDVVAQKFQLSHRAADTSTLRVRVQENELSTSFDIYSKFESLKNVDSSTKTYYLQENSSGFYEIYFGDGVTGFKPINNNIVTIDYLVTDGEESNGASTFEFSGTLGGFSSVINTTTINNSAGGAEQETIESVRFNAPLTFATQNRAVTSDDYAAIIKQNFTNISSISTWGGEDNDPPDFGKAYISVKPISADKLTDAEKTTITDTILKGKNVVSITPEIVDAEFTNLELDVFVKFNPSLTDRTEADLSSVVRDTIADYSFNNLNRFDGVFRHSELLAFIDNSDPSVTSSNVRPRMFQNITTLAGGVNNDFELTFAEPFFQTGDSTKFILDSTAFKLNIDPTQDHFLGDIPITGTNQRQIIVYKIIEGQNITVINNAGILDVDNGKITLNNFATPTATTIKVTVVPNSLDIAPVRNQLIQIDNTFVDITVAVDTIATSGVSGGIKYNTNSRIK